MSRCRSLLTTCCLFLACGLPGCMLKVALDSPSQPLEHAAFERLEHDADRIASAAGEVKMAAYEVGAKAAPDLGSIYNRAAQAADKDRNPVIVIPGILGSKLVEDSSGEIVWGEFGGKGIDPDSSRGAQLFALPMAEGRALGELKSRVRPDGALGAVKIKFLGLPIQIGAYRDILAALGVGGYADPYEKIDIDYDDGHFTCFQFGYDWRRDNAENARRLHEFILEKKAYVESERVKRYGSSGPVRFDIVAHSMGGLLARYYLMYGPAELPADGAPPVLTWSGAQHVERLVQVGTPNAGSAKTFEELVTGVQFSKLLPTYDAALWGTMPAAYQLLPRTRHQAVYDAKTREEINLFDPRVWERYSWGLLDPKQDEVLKKLLPGVRDPQQRRRIAADHLRKCLQAAETFHAAIDRPAAPPKGTSIHLIAGDAHQTMSRVKVQPDGTVESGGRSAGDGVVTRDSALMDERLADPAHWSPRLNSPVQFQSVTFLFASHMGLTSDPTFTDNVLFLLLEAPRQ